MHQKVVKFCPYQPCSSVNVPDLLGASPGEGPIHGVQGAAARGPVRAHQRRAQVRHLVEIPPPGLVAHGGGCSDTLQGRRLEDLVIS